MAFMTAVYKNNVVDTITNGGQSQCIWIRHNQCERQVWLEAIAIQQGSISKAHTVLLQVDDVLLWVIA